MQGPALVLTGVVLGGALTTGWFLHRLHATEQASTQPTVRPHHGGEPVRAGHGRLTHPLLTCSADPGDAADLAPMQTAIQDFAGKAMHEGMTRFAVHVTDLESCRWFELGSAETFHPASMMKVPLALTWMKRSLADPTVLGRRLVFDVPPEAESREDKNLPTALVSGQGYEVADLLRRMLVDSRNDAKWLLNRDVPTSALDEVWTDLGLRPPSRDTDPLVTVHDMATMFHALYDGAWLGRDASERVLGWLADATYKEGLTAKLPEGALVAHKYGRRVRQNPPAGSWWLQLHDCGILYRSGHPMLACVMTEGMNEPVQQKFIADVAGMLWSVAQAP